MSSSKRYLETAISDEDEFVSYESKTPEFEDRFGIRISLIILAVGLLMGAFWMSSRSGFEKCFALQDATKRHECYDDVRAEQLTPPAKGGEGPAAAFRSPQ